MMEMDLDEYRTMQGYRIERIADDYKHYLIIKTCGLCGERITTQITRQGLWDWEHGANIQYACPDLSTDEREQIITSTHVSCLDALYANDDALIAMLSEKLGAVVIEEDE